MFYYAHIRKKCQFFSAILMFFCVLAVGCGSPEGNDSGQGMVFFDGVDDQGTRVVLKKCPERIVSLSVGLDEILLVLVEPERIQALSWYTSDPEMSPMAQQAVQYPRIQGRNPEAVFAYRPDLVLMSGSEHTPKAYVQALRDLGIPVYVSDSPHQLAAVFRRIEQMGRLLGEENGAAVLLQEMKASLQKVDKAVLSIPPEQRSVVMAFGNSGGVFGRKDDLFDDMCTHAGLRNGAAMAGLTAASPISKEQIVAINPDVFLLPTWSKEGQVAAAASEQIMTDPAFKDVKAVKNHCFIYVSDRYRYSTSQYAVTAVEKLAQAVYPERFSQ
jgi:iron complex transport system substrate-binding protein